MRLALLLQGCLGVNGVAGKPAFRVNRMPAAFRRARKRESA